MSSWRPGRSPSPPYRSRRYSPSREVSPPPPRLNDDNHYRPPPMTAKPMRSEHYSPPQARPRSRSPSPRYREARYREEEPVSRRYRSPTPPRLVPARRTRPGAADFYDAPPQDERRMVADREETRMREIPPPRHAKVEEQWERGHEVQNDYAPGYQHQVEQEYHAEDKYEDDKSRKGKGTGPSQSFRDVIFLGLDEELTEDDFFSFLKAEHGANVSSVKIVRDRVTGKSKYFGFAQFASVEDAEDFVLPNFPYITMPALYAHSQAHKVKIDFSAPLGASASNGAGPIDISTLEPARRHDGTRHIGQPGGGKRVLLLRMLDWNTRGEEIIWRISQEIARLLHKQGEDKEAEGCIVRAATIQDKAGRGASWGFAFVELVTPELAAALLSFLLSPQSQPHGFLIANRPIAISFADPAAFEPASAGPLGGQFLLRSTRNGGIGSDTIGKSEGGWCAYANEQAGAVETVPAKGQAISEDGSLPEMTPQLRSFLGVFAGKRSDEVETAPSSLPTGGIVNIANVMQPIKIGTTFGAALGKGKKEEGYTPRKNLFGDEEETDLVGKDTVLLSRTKGAHIVPPTSGSRKIAKNISKWNTKQSELAAPEPSSSSSRVPKGVSSANTAVLGSTQRVAPTSTLAGSSVNASTNTNVGQRPPQPVASSSKAQSPSSPVASDGYDYSDVQASGKVACLLCQRALPSAEVMRKHVLTSELHKTNLANPSVVEAGKKRKQASLAKLSTTPDLTGNGEDQPKYRDRAAERREVFNQPEKPHYMDRVALSIPSGPPKRKFAEGPKEPSPPPEPGLAPGVDESNKGNTLLTKMGWAAGTGLGKGKEGRVEPIEVKLLGERAGLGAKR